ncbi:VWA domain-containing protein [Microbacterium sp. gxy059]|uniref:VWA domain-containing protein n=1 Tax=Microbacterium sp. gxy059 TaxID=2957199 RepID=UPI003D9A03F7
MALEHVWILVALAALLVAAVAAGLLLGGRRPRRDAADAPAVARAERVARLDATRRAVRRRTAALAAVAGLAVVGGLAAAAVAARPMSTQTIVPENTSRDIMLCLDVSGSMTDVDAEVVQVFEQLARGFEGERIGLTIFNSSAVQVFPLTDDYAFVAEHLQRIREGFTGYESNPEHWAGTLEGAGSSLIGDGLASCAMRFDHDDEERSRSIILATDNEQVGSGIVDLDEAAAFAADRGIRVFSIDPVTDTEGETATALAAAARHTGGAGYSLRGTTTVADVIDEVQKEEARAIAGMPETVRTDAPAPWIVVLLAAALASILVAWRIRA